MDLYRQLPLPFPYRPRFAETDFLPASSNEAARAWLQRPQDWPDRRLALWGPAGCGKTHLLTVWATRAGADLLSGAALRDFPFRAGATALAVDDADMMTAEEPLLHLLNAAVDARVPVLLTGRTPPARWLVHLPDLTSRLRAVTAVEIRAPEDSLLRALLARLLAERQIAVADAVQDWLLLRLPRTAAALREAVGQLDRASLAVGGRIIRPLAAEVLAAVDHGEAIPSDSDPFGPNPSSPQPGFL